MSGQGIYYWSTGDIFEGNFEDDRRNGEGLLTLVTGEIVQANWKMGKMVAEDK